ncbi:aminotransferase [Kineococcus sp. SYSU DK006]|uniref:aminotransferase n=1 Tax=Kineococcus sp. SYSU DK006 TaxID=3383127 RepID=UPI003D7CCA50
MDTAPRTFDFFTAGELPAPTVPPAEVEELVAEHFGWRVELQALGSQQDQNFLAREPGGAHPVAVVKLANPAFSLLEAQAQDAAADAVAAANPDLAVSRLLERGGRRLRAVLPTSQGPLVVRLLEFLPHGTLVHAGHLRPQAVARFGEVAAAVSLALAPFEHPGTERVLQWDLRHASRVVRALVDAHPDPARARRVRRAADQAWERVQRVADRLPVQAGHFDLTDDNLTAQHAGSTLAGGVLDFGDVTTSWAVAELAVTLSSVLHHPGAEPADVLPAVRAFHERRPLSPEELEALWPLVVLRGAVLVVSGEQQVAVDATGRGDGLGAPGGAGQTVGNGYAAAALEREWRIFEVADSEPLDVVTAALRAALGVPARRVRPTGRAAAPAGPLELVDLSVTSPSADEGAWQDGPALLERAVRRVLATGAGALVPFGVPRIDRTRALSATSAATVPTGASWWPSGDVALHAPWPGRRRVRAGVLELRSAQGTLVLHGLDPDGSDPDGGDPDGGDPDGGAAGAEVAAGERLGTARAGARLDVQLLDAGVPAEGFPLFVRPELALGWLSLAHDPAPLLGAPAAPDPARTFADPAELLARRDAVFATVQEHYYEAPPRIERGWRHHLLDTTGRCYLDMVNNVTSVGHAHPRVTEAATAQLRRLNTNSRFHYGALVEFAERIADLLPAPLDTVFLVNSGSEAVDLALRVAMAATGRRDVVSVLEAYHGWTLASDAVSTSTADNPAALQTRPDWVHTVDAPNPYRGRHRDAEARRYGPEAAARIAGLAAEGRAPAAFIAETFYGNAGGVRLPDGYLAQVYAAVRAAGGLAVADEVQVGYGRLGEFFWGFEQQGVVPDVVAVAKAVGNGFPLGIVATSRQVAERYRSQGYFFSSSGGSPLSCAVGSAVLDVIAEEGLQENARTVGGHLRARLLDLAAAHPLIGAVHGSGLYVGVDLVEDPVTRAPAAAAAAGICDRMLRLGIVLQRTGEHGNVLKVKPPLCLDVEAADFFADALGRVLAEGW